MEIRSQAATARCTIGDFTNSSSAALRMTQKAASRTYKADTLLHLRQHLLVASHTLFSSLIDKLWFGRIFSSLQAFSETSSKKVKLCEVAHKQMPQQIIESICKAKHIIVRERVITSHKLSAISEDKSERSELRIVQDVLVRSLKGFNVAGDISFPCDSQYRPM